MQRCLVGAAGCCEVAQVTADAGHTGVAVEGVGSELGCEGREEGRGDETTQSNVWGQKKERELWQVL